MLIAAEQMSFGFEGEILLDGIDFSLSEGDRVGLIGGNGEGKTTLLRVILGELSPEKGSIYKKNNINIGYLQQNGGYDSENTVFEEMREIFSSDIKAIESLRAIEEKISTTKENTSEYISLSGKYEALNKQIAARDSYHYEVRIRTVLNGMGFENVYEQKISTMSGGEKTRLKLCRLLLEEPELLILDEPTNHLDVKTLFWLEDYLSRYKGAILTVSHDRFFLDRTVKEIYELENKKLCVFKGNYTKYKQLKAEKIERQQKEYDKQQEEIAHLQDYVNRNLVRATTAKSAQSRIKQLDRMEIIEKPLSVITPPRFSFTYTEKPYEKVLEVNALKLFAGEKLLLNNATFTVMRGEKCAIVGDNGTGKSTLVKEIVKNHNENIHTGRFVKIACYDQENANLNPENTVISEFWERHVLWDQTKVRNILAQVKLSQEDMGKKVKSLSGGERAKLALAVFECEMGNFLILDEPTNHLDLPARESLETALKNFDGTILFVSHDRYFIQALAGKIIELKEGNLTEFKGTYMEYSDKKNADKKKAEEEKAQAEFNKREEKRKEERKTTYKTREEKALENRKKERIKILEKEIEALEEKSEIINAEIILPEIVSNYILLQEKCKALDDIKNKLDLLYGEYETLI